jgi:hypothetical protein
MSASIDASHTAVIAASLKLDSSYICFVVWPK